MTLEEAREVLHVEAGDNDQQITSLILAAESYISNVTGIPYRLIDSYCMTEAAMKYLLTMWYYADHSDDQALTRVVDSILRQLTYEHASEERSESNL